MGNENIACVEENAALGGGTAQRNVAPGDSRLEGGEKQAASEE